MKIYSYYGINDFIICLGYKGDRIKEYFRNYHYNKSDFSVDLGNNEYTYHSFPKEKWKVTLVDTGLETMTGGRLGRVAEYLKNEDIFCLTYGDGVTDIDIAKLIAFHRRHGKVATLTAVLPPEQFGILDIDSEDNVASFSEKPVQEDRYINGGFFVFSPKILEFISGDETVLERYPLAELARLSELKAYRHNGFWQCMDTLRDKNYLETLYKNDQAPWIKWR